MQCGCSDLLDCEHPAPKPTIEHEISSAESARIRLPDRAAQGVGSAAAGPAAAVNRIPIDAIILGPSIHCR